MWDDDDAPGDLDDNIDNFTFPLSNPLKKFNLSNSLTVEGHHEVGNLTLSYGNITAGLIPCNSMKYVMSSTFAPTHYGNPTTAPCQCNSVEYPMPIISTQTHQGKWYTKEN